MNLELLYWIGVWFLLSEVLFIIGLKKNWDVFNKESDDEPLVNHWILWKFCSFLLITLFIFIQAVFVFPTLPDGRADYSNPRYIIIFYEFWVIIGITILFGVNKLIVSIIKVINKNEVKQKCLGTKIQ